MAQIEEFATTKAEAQKIEREKKSIKKGVTSEEKRKYIAYGVIGLISLGFVLFAVNDFGGDEKNKEVTEIATPESETDKYNSKLEAVQQGDKPVSTSNNSLMDAYKKDNSNSETNSDDEETKRLEEEIKKMNNEKEEPVTTAPVKKSRSTNSYSPVRERQYSSSSIKKTESKKSEKESVQDDFGDFFSSSTKSKASAAASNVQESDPFFYGVIKGDHLGLKNKQRVALMLPKDATINGKVYKKNTVIYAIATFGASRVNLTINNINQVPVSIKAYDAEDGGVGLQVRESLVSETSTEMVSEGADELDLNGVPFGNTIKKILKKKNKEAKIDLLNNQKMILKIDR